MGITNKQRGLSVFPEGVKGKAVVVLSADGAIPIPEADTRYKITKAGVAALTLADPTAAKEGLTLEFTNQTANAHTITTVALLDNGIVGGSKNVATFAAFAGSAITLRAQNLKWAVVSANACPVA